MLKRFLPSLLSLVLLLTIFSSFSAPLAYAQVINNGPSPVPGTWQRDSEVEFAGKNATRSKDLLNWVIAKHEWSNISGTNNPFTQVWVSVRNLVYALLTITIIVAAFLIIVTRGENLTIKKYAVRFIVVVILITLSFAIIQFIYVFFDIIQGFFLRKRSGDYISSSDLLSISFNYKGFEGFRIAGIQYEESAIISLLLVKLTAATYYAMFIILMIRKIILWFFIVVSPIFPLLWLFNPLRNSAKIWVGEFFRWVLYGPLFAIFLAGLVTFWANWGPQGPLDLTPLKDKDGQVIMVDGKPSFPALPCDSAQTEENVVYPTAINILIGGPCQAVNKYNNVNIPSSFIEYIVALLMLWMVILMPFILLRIFLDYLYNFSYGESNMAKYITQLRSSPFLERYGLGSRNPQRPKGPPPPAGSTGLAKEIPTFTAFPTNAAIENKLDQAISADKDIAAALKQNIEISNQSSAQMNQAFEKSYSSASNISSNLSSTPAFYSTSSAAYTNADEVSAVQNLTNLPIPTIIDIAIYETMMISNDAHQQEMVNRLAESLNRIGGTSTLVTAAERDKYEKVKGKLEEISKSNVAAASVLSATMPKVAQLPQANKVQTVNLEDYEHVKKMWKDNYTKQDPPADSKFQNKKEWLKSEVDQMAKASTLLSSNNPQQEKMGREMVSKILPFMLLGGFSKQEMVGYLKAKQSAAKDTLDQIGSREGEEFVDVKEKTEEMPKVMHASQEIEDSEGGEEASSISPEAMGISVGDGAGSESSSISAATMESVANYINQADVNTIKTLTGLPVPTLKDIASYEAALLSKETSKREPVQAVITSLEKLSGFRPAANPSEKAEYDQIKGQLGASVQAGSAAAESVLAASNPETALLPENNKIQHVGVEDYENVRGIWVNNYQQLTPPLNLNKQQWLQSESDQITKAIELLSSGDSEQVRQGKSMVSTILPFLLLGGFSKQEIIEYLKAKQAAATQVQENEKKSGELVDAKGVAQQADPKAMVVSETDQKTSVSK